MRKTETLVSVALGAAFLLVVLSIERRLQLSSSARTVPSVTKPDPAVGSGGPPDSYAYTRIRTYHLGSYRADLYRAASGALDFAPAQFVIFDRSNQPAFKLEGLESLKRAWTVLYDFRGGRGPGRRASRRPPVYTRSLTGNGEPDIVLGQYSGGERCCTTVTVVELGRKAVRMVGRVDGLSGLPFENLEIRKLERGPSWQLIANRQYSTPCGSPDVSADVPSIYAYSDDQFTLQTSRYAGYLEGILHRNFARWASADQRSFQLLSTLALDYAALGRLEESRRFIAANAAQFLPTLRAEGLEPKACITYLENLSDQMASIAKGAGHLRRSGSAASGAR